MRLDRRILAVLSLAPAVAVPAILVYARALPVEVVRHSTYGYVTDALEAEKSTLHGVGWIPGRLFLMRDIGSTAYPNDDFEVRSRVITRHDVKWYARKLADDRLGNTLEIGHIRTAWGIGVAGEEWSLSGHHGERIEAIVIRDWLLVILAVLPGFVVAIYMMVRGLLARPEPTGGFRVLPCLVMKGARAP